MHRVTLLAAFALPLLGALAGCATTAARDDAAALAGTTWQITGYNDGRQTVVSVIAGTTLSLAFAADGGLTGSGGCNRYRATYSTAGGNLRIGAVASTRMACADPPGVMEQEQAFFAALASVARARIDGDRLELRMDDDGLAVTAVAAESRK